MYYYGFKSICLYGKIILPRWYQCGLDIRNIHIFKRGYTGYMVPE